MIKNSSIEFYLFDNIMINSQHGNYSNK
jgi:hypothetical protein